MMTMVVPKLLEIFEDKSTLPASTKALIAISDFMVAYWYIIIAIFVGSLFLLSVWKQTPS